MLSKGTADPIPVPPESVSGARAPHAIICFMWRPPGAVVRDGGFRRIYALLEHSPEGVTAVLIDRRPSPLASKAGLRIVEYGIPSWLSSVQSRMYVVGGLLEALLVTVKLFIRGWREIRRTPSSVLYVPVSEIPWLTVPAYALSRLRHKRLVLVNQNTKGVLGGRLGQWVNWRIHSRADGVIAVSDAIKAELIAVGVKRGIVVNGNGFDRPEGLDVVGTRPTRWAATYVGRLQPEKGMDDLLQTWSLVTRKAPEADLLLVGFATAGHHKEIRRRLGKLGLEGRVHLVGVISEEEKWDAMARSRLCLFLSPIEGWGLVPIEALSIGLPVVLYDLPAYRESLAGLKGVYRVPVGDVASAANVAVQLLTLDATARADLTREITSSFRYPSWREVAAREVALVRPG